MAIISDPDNLTYELATTPSGTAMLTVDLADKLFTLTKVGALTDDGVTLQCLFSKITEIWNDEAAAIKYKFPLESITNKRILIKEGWDFGDNTTRYLIRTGGWALVDGAGASLEEWACIKTVGSINAGHQVYFRQVAGDGAATNFQLTGPVNQAIKIYGDATHGNFDYRNYLKVFCREQGYTYSEYTNTQLGETTLTYDVYGPPISNAVDPKVTESDVTVSGYGVTITWYGSAQARNISGTNRYFHVIIDGNNKTAEEIYMAVQRLLRQTGDIDSGAGTKTGNITNQLLQFIGDDLYCLLDSTGGVFIDNYQLADINRLHFIDDGGVERQFNFVATLRINFNENLQNDPAAIYRVFFTTNPAGNFGTANAVIVDDADGVDMSGTVSAATYVEHTFNFDANTQGGRTAGTNADITVVAIGQGIAAYVLAEGTIVRSTANVITLYSPLERNYLNL